MKAAWNGDAEMVKHLLAAGANVNAVNKNNLTALFMAALQGRLEILRILVDAGAGVNTCNKDGWPVVMAAARNGHAEVVRQLIIAGADVNVASNKGGTALGAAEWAANNQAEIRKMADEGYIVGFEHAEIVRLLKAAGARR